MKKIAAQARSHGQVVHDQRQSYVDVNFDSVEDAFQHFSTYATPIRILPGPHSTFHYGKQVSSIGNAIFTLSKSMTGWGFADGVGPDGFTICITKLGLASWHLGSRHIECEPSSGIMLDNLMIDGGRFSPGINNETAYFDAYDLQKVLTELLGCPLQKRLSFSSKTLAMCPILDAISELMRIIRLGLSGAAPLDNAPIALCNLTQALHTLVLEGIPHNYSIALTRKTTAPAPRAVVRAIDYMQANADTPITVADIAKFSCVSVRAIQAGFKQFKGMTPMTYLREIRLQRVKTELEDPENYDDIREVALRWGFVHLYEFVRSYQLFTGEHPRETLLRKRAIQANSHLPAD